MPEDRDRRDRLDDAVVRAAAAALESAPPARAASFVQAYGPVVGPFALAAEEARRTEARKQVDQLSAALATARKELEQRTVTLAAELEPLRLEMDALRDEWTAACERYEAKRIANQAAVIPLQNRLAELVAQLNAPASGYAHNIRQWQSRNDLPKVPRDDVG
jgi:uncharacterized protein YukE